MEPGTIKRRSAKASLHTGGLRIIKPNELHDTPVLLLLICLLIAQANTANAQQPAFPKVSAVFDQVPVQQFLAEMERQSGYTFYYDTLQFDSLKISITLRDEPLDKALGATFKGSSLNYSFDENKTVLFQRD